MADPNFEEIRCALCGADRTQVVFHRPYQVAAICDNAVYTASTDEFQDYGRIVRCLDCGLIYTNPRPLPGSLLKGYADCVDENYLAESSSRSINAHLSLNTLKRFIKSGKLLEVGASTGYFLNAARTDFDVVGLEPSEWAGRIARERFKLDVYPESFLTTQRFAPCSLDCVAMIDVIEHLPDPARAMARAAELLRPGGILYLVTPDVSSLSARILGSYWWGLRPAHIYFFDGRTLGKMLDKAGFEVLQVESFGRIFSWGYWAGKMRHYPAWIYQPLLWMIRSLGIEEKVLYINTRDSMEVLARKR
ncbi:MAG: class I SAM-dependent methyltransferase [Elusimicrobiota bacterium]